jgi:hypothetical protein
MLKTWQYTLAFTVHTLVISWCLYFLVPDHTELGGARKGGSFL